MGVLISCATAPINMLVGFLFENIISAPSADEYKVEQQDRQLRESAGGPASTMAARGLGAIRNSISIARHAIAPILPVSMQQTQGSRKLSSRVSLLFMEHFTVPDATTRALPEEVIQSYAATSMILKDAFAPKEPKAVTRTSIIVPRRVSALLATDTDDEYSLFDTAERGEMNDASETSFNSFYAMLRKQDEYLSGEARADFQERWGAGLEYDASDKQATNRSVPSGISAKIRRKLSWGKDKTTRTQVLSAAIEETSHISNEKIAKLKIAPDIHVGLEIMHHFIIDLLG